MHSLDTIAECLAMASSSTDRAAKCRKLHFLRMKLPHMSKTALQSVLLEVRQHGIPEYDRRQDQLAGLRDELAQHCAYGNLLQETAFENVDGSHQTQLMVNPLSLLHGSISQGGSYEELVLRTLRRTKCDADNPWNLVIYCDEVVPGNPLAVRLDRKAHLFYFTFLEFGQRALSNTAAWLICGLHTSVSVQAMSAGVSQLMAKVVKAFFCAESCDVLDGGLFVKLSTGRTISLHFQMGFFLQDGAAHKAVFCLKADSGCRFCILCKNMFCSYSKDSDATDTADEDDSPEDGLICTTCKYSDLVLATDAEILQAADRLAQRAQELDAGTLRQWETAVGMTHQPHGILLDKDLREKGLIAPVTQYVHDAMHALASSGALHTVVYLFLSALLAAKVQI